MLISQLWKRPWILLFALVCTLGGLSDATMAVQDQGKSQPAGSVDLFLSPAVQQRGQVANAMLNTANWNQSLNLAQRPAQDDGEANQKMKELHERLQELDQERAKLYQQYYSQSFNQGFYGAAAQQWRQQANAFDALKYYQEYAKAIKENGDAEDKFWIGVQSAPLPSDIREFLGLDEQIGLLVASVIEDSPAAKEGVQKNDVIIEVNDQPIRSLAELVHSINVRQGEAIELRLNRKGSEVVVRVTPERRPEPAQEEANQLLQADPHLNQLFHQHLMQLNHNGENVPTASIQLWGPAGAQDLAKVEIPDDIHFEISAVGDGPFELNIKSDEAEHTVALNELSELPDQMRVYAHAFLQKFRQRSSEVMNWNTDWSSSTSPTAAGVQWLQLHQSSRGDWAFHPPVVSGLPMIWYGDYAADAQGQTSEGDSMKPDHDDAINSRLDRLEELMHQMQQQIREIKK